MIILLRYIPLSINRMSGVTIPFEHLVCSNQEWAYNTLNTLRPGWGWGGEDGGGEGRWVV